MGESLGGSNAILDTEIKSFFEQEGLRNWSTKVPEALFEDLLMFKSGIQGMTIDAPAAKVQL